MPLFRGCTSPVRRAPRSVAYRSTDLMKDLRPGVTTWVEPEGLKRLGARAWTRPEGSGHLIVAVQARQSGWDPYAGNTFIVEFAVSHTAKVGTGSRRARLWSLLDNGDRHAAHELASQVRLTLPSPAESYVRSLPDQTVRDWYLAKFEVPSIGSPADDVWFPYYDESDAGRWGVFLGSCARRALQAFLDPSLPPGPQPRGE